MSPEFEKRGKEFIDLLDYVFPEIYAHNPFSGYLLLLVIESLREVHDEKLPVPGTQSNSTLDDLIASGRAMRTRGTSL